MCQPLFKLSGYISEQTKLPALMEFAVSSHRTFILPMLNKTQLSACLKVPCGPKWSITNCLWHGCKFTNILHLDMQKIFKTCLFNMWSNLPYVLLPGRKWKQNKTTRFFFSHPMQLFNHYCWIMLSLYIERKREKEEAVYQAII